MDSELAERIKNWVSMSDSVAKIYMKLVTLEQDGKINDEFWSLKDLLPKAVELESTSFVEIGVNGKNIYDVCKVIEISDPDYEAAVEGGNILEFANLRRNKFFAAHVLYKFDATAESIKKSVTDGKDHKGIVTKAAHKKYDTEIDVRLRLIQAYIIDRYIKSIENERIKNYLIYLKYLIFATNPGCEKHWFENHQLVLPPIDILHNFPVFPYLSESYAENHARLDLTNGIYNNIERISQIDNFDIKAPRNGLFYILTQLEAELIAMRDMQYIKDLEDYTERVIPEGIFYTEIKRYILSVFDDAKVLVRGSLQNKKNGS